MPEASGEWPLRCIYLYLSGSCNLACRHCWIDPKPAGRGERHLTLDEIRAILTQALELGLRSVKLTGGEPFLHPEVLGVLALLGELGLEVIVETNGTLIAGPQAAALRAVGAHCSVSLDGTTAEMHEDLRGVRGAFQRALSGLAALREAGVAIQIVSSLYRRNATDLLQMPAFARRLGAGSLKINPVNAVTRSTKMRDDGELLSVPEVLKVLPSMREQAETAEIHLAFDVPPAFKLLSELRRSGSSMDTCGILGILGVLHNGHASLCGIGQVIEALDFGDLLELGVRKVWEQEPILQQVRQMVPRRLGGICARCMLRHYCFGKCLAHTYVHTGSLFAGFPFCEEARAVGLFPLSRLVDPADEP